MLTLRAGVLALLLGVGGLVVPGVTRASDGAVAEDALKRLQISDDQRRALGTEVVSFAVDEQGERELAVGLAILVMAPLGHVAESLVSDELLARDSTISARGPMPDPAAAVPPPPPLRFTGSERSEAESLRDAVPGTRFNLSPGEIAALHALRTSQAPVEPVSSEYWKLLRARAQAYQRGGLAAIAPYARDGRALTDPAAELRRAIPDAERVARLGPRLRDALARYPAAQPDGAVSRVSWVKRRVQRRPHVSLLHQLVMAEPDLAVHVERYVYVEHSYNAAQIITGAFAYGEGTVVFTVSRLSTDEVLGFGNQLKRAVGRSLLRDETRRRLEASRRAAAAGPVRTRPER